MKVIYDVSQENHIFLMYKNDEVTLGDTNDFVGDNLKLFLKDKNMRNKKLFSVAEELIVYR